MSKVGRILIVPAIGAIVLTAGALASWTTKAFGFGISRELRAPNETQMAAVKAPPNSLGNGICNY